MEQWVDGAIDGVMSGLRWLDAERDTRRLAAVSVATTPATHRRDITSGELDALMRRHEMTLVFGGGHYVAKCTLESARIKGMLVYLWDESDQMHSAVLGLVEQVEKYRAWEARVTVAT